MEPARQFQIKVICIQFTRMSLGKAWIHFKVKQQGWLGSVAIFIGNQLIIQWKRQQKTTPPSIPKTFFEIQIEWLIVIVW